MKKTTEDMILERIMNLVCEIETKQKQYQESPSYDGGYAKNVLGMIEALNIVTGKTWRWDGNMLKLHKE